jgi:hypothetical protein
VGQRDLFAGQASEQVRGRLGSGGQPGQAGQRVVHAEQLLGERDQLGMDAAGAVV